MSLSGKPTLTTPSPIENDGFWFDLDVGELMSKYRVPPEYADDTISWGLTLAMANVNDQVSAVRTEMEAQGYINAAAYITANPQPINDAIDWLELQYKDAVYSHAKAYLLQQFNSLNRKPNAENAAKESPETEQWWLNQSAAAIAKLFKKFIPDTYKPSSGNYVKLI